MRHTLTAVFDDRGDAQHALNKLLAAGYLRADATLSLATPTGEGEGSPASYSDASAGQRHVLTLTTESDPEAERAVALVVRLIPLEDKQYHGNSHYFGTRDSDNASPLGTTFRDTLFSATKWTPHDDDSTNAGTADPRQAAARSRNDRIAAYRYGNEMRTSEKYRNRSWNEVGDALRSEWESRNPGVSNWEASKPVIRSGWEATTPDIDEDSYYRTHWNARYAHNAHDARGPGGHALAGVNREEASHGFPYRIRHWAAAAADLKTGWASGHAGELPPWERFKDALFHGWSRISLGNGETAATTAGIDDLAPAYRFGNEMHHTDRFRSRGWDDVENELHEDWDSRYGGRGLASWDMNKVAVRYGWEQPTSAA